VTDSRGLASDPASVTITAGNSPTGGGHRHPDTTTHLDRRRHHRLLRPHQRPQDDTLPATRLSWSLILHHCATPTDCHTHAVQDFNGVASGSFSAPDHKPPAWTVGSSAATTPLPDPLWCGGW